MASSSSSLLPLPALSRQLRDVDLTAVMCCMQYLEIPSLDVSVRYKVVDVASPPVASMTSSSSSSVFGSVNNASRVTTKTKTGFRRFIFSAASGLNRVSPELQSGLAAVRRAHTVNSATHESKPEGVQHVAVAEVRVHAAPTALSANLFDVNGLGFFLGGSAAPAALPTMINRDATSVGGSSFEDVLATTELDRPSSNEVLVLLYRKIREGERKVAEVIINCVREDVGGHDEEVVVIYFDAVDGASIEKGNKVAAAILDSKRQKVKAGNFSTFKGSESGFLVMVSAGRSARDLALATSFYCPAACLCCRLLVTVYSVDSMLTLPSPPFLFSPPPLDRHATASIALASKWSSRQRTTTPPSIRRGG